MRYTDFGKELFLRPFMQTFVLAPESSVVNRVYVDNDIFRYQDEVFGGFVTEKVRGNRPIMFTGEVSLNVEERTCAAKDQDQEDNTCGDLEPSSHVVGDEHNYGHLYCTDINVATFSSIVE
ncbi:Ras GTPase-activating protein-binding protein 1 [Fukomys damarensis]|uniref:Ras GTPase-activating protein-binding protein 1 n=1 Tax=Fukomys damarensis TaxID=885580 RepID=A0A091D0I7_FUKDA|nr:Ras GTPase-activating protein-binding protein 1 [Fukomys damarensis]